MNNNKQFSKRFDHDCNDIANVQHYFLNRAKQLQHIGAKLISIHELEGGAIAKWNYNNKNYQSIYIYKSFRNLGLYKKYINEYKLPILTINECEIIDYLIENNIEYLELDNNWRNTIINSYDYKVIQKFYGDKKAKRSQQFYMNHIDEGLVILNEIGASRKAKLGYCLHPLFQKEEDLILNFKRDDIDDIRRLDPYAIIAAMEYRNIANKYLSHRKINRSKLSMEIELSCIPEVNDMLVADKIQNYKDFMIFHYGKHERRKEIKEYFWNWFTRLQIDHDVERLIKLIS